MLKSRHEEVAECRMARSVNQERVVFQFSQSRASNFPSTKAIEDIKKAPLSQSNVIQFKGSN